MIMVFHVEHIPGLAVELFLPVGEGMLHPLEDEGGGQIVGEQTVGALALELDHHVNLTAFILFDIGQSLPGRYQGRFCQSHGIVMVEHILLEFHEILVDVRTVIVIGHAFVDGEQMIIRQTFLLGDISNYIFTEAVHPHVQPESQNLLNFLTHQRIIHVQVRLLDTEQM